MKLKLPTSDLVERYREPHRRYHTLAHVHECLDELKTVRGLSTGERDALEAAIWFHDAVFDPRSSENEAESAELAKQAMEQAGVPAPVREEVARLIKLTVSHRAAPGDRLGALMVSIDLAKLGGEPAAYDRYTRAVREEYAFIPEPIFRAGRAALLQRLLSAPEIYPDPTFRDRFEAKARANLERELAALHD
jgi:predicted metal-dependent HD superfamily phosphohydrolase